jgi:hypothetical protein
MEGRINKSLETFRERVINYEGRVAFQRLQRLVCCIPKTWQWAGYFIW